LITPNPGAGPALNNQPGGNGTKIETPRRIPCLRFVRNATQAGLAVQGSMVEFSMSWDRPFAQPVPLPEGPPAQTLQAAADYIRKLPQPERDGQEWRLAVQMLVDAAEDRGPMLLARIGIVRAMEAHAEGAFSPGRPGMLPKHPKAFKAE
jgi:hypothetical protein